MELQICNNFRQKISVFLPENCKSVEIRGFRSGVYVLYIVGLEKRILHAVTKKQGAACFIYETKLRDFRFLFHLAGAECCFLKVLPYTFNKDKNESDLWRSELITLHRPDNKLPT